VNREMKRMMQRQGQVGQDGQPLAAPQQRARLSSRPANAPRRTPWAYFKEVRNEMRKVNWPSRTEVRNYSTVVLATLIFMVALIFVLDYFFSGAAVFLFK
jgi:preprotein translocase subunit SecE